MPTFDVLLPVKNCKTYLAESIESIKRQSFRDWRLLVLDHGSQDGSLELAYALSGGDPRIKVHSLPQAAGLSGLLNIGIALCDAKYLLRQDADDLSEPNRLEVLNEVFEMHPDLVLAGSLGEVINGHGQRIGAIDMPLGAGAVGAAAFFRIPVLHPSAAMRLDSLHRLGARYGTDFLRIVPANERLLVPGLAEDYYLFGQLSLVARCLNVNRQLIKFRWHDSNISKIKELAQLRVAVDISRYLANSFAVMHDVPHFDPAPFSNHGMRLLDIVDQSDFEQEFLWMNDSLGAVLPDSPALRREMSFRHSVALRPALPMARRYAAHARRHGLMPHERNTVKAWLLRKIRKQPSLRLALHTMNA
jgi:glycosyltransferase involved in cell wall biosynthesis